MIEIKEVNWLSMDAKEAEVCLYDGSFYIKCFSQPFNNELILPLYAINTNNIKHSYEKTYLVEKIGENFEYRFLGYILDKVKGNIKIGKFIIQLDIPLPKDMKEKEYISFQCDRIDIW